MIADDLGPAFTSSFATRIANGFAKLGAFAKGIWTFAKFCLALRVATWITSVERQAKPTLLN